MADEKTPTLREFLDTSQPASTEDRHAASLDRLKGHLGDDHEDGYITLSLPDMFQRPNSKGEMKPRDQGDMTDEEYAKHWAEVHKQNAEGDIARYDAAVNGADKPN